MLSKIKLIIVFLIFSFLKKKNNINHSLVLRIKINLFHITSNKFKLNLKNLR